MIKGTSKFYREQPAKLLQKMVGDKADKKLVIKDRKKFATFFGKERK